MRLDLLSAGLSVGVFPASMTDYSQSGKIGVGGDPGYGFSVKLNEGCSAFEGKMRGPKIQQRDVLTLRLNCGDHTLELLVNGKAVEGLLITDVEPPVRAGMALTGNSLITTFFPRPGQPDVCLVSRQAESPPPPPQGGGGPTPPPGRLVGRSA